MGTIGERGGERNSYLWLLNVTQGKAREKRPCSKQKTGMGYEFRGGEGEVPLVFRGRSSKDSVKKGGK